MNRLSPAVLFFIFYDLGALTAFFYGFSRDQEKILDIFEELAVTLIMNHTTLQCR